ncbi:MAG: 2-hydroxy-3-oxopropionate reductase [Mariniphaga sp.]
MNIGFIGLGIMGVPMAQHLINDGHQLFVNTVGPVPASISATSASVCASAEEVTRNTDIVFIMVPDTPDVEAVLFGAGGVAAALPGVARKIIVDMSSISPMATKTFAQKINALGADYIDAPVSGGEVGAKAASLTIMCGGSEKAFETVRPLFEKMGKNITLVGGNGDGQTTKVANQIIVALNIAAVSEAFVLATKAGVNPEAVFNAIKGGLAGSTVMNAKVPMILDGNFKPGFRIELHIKDLQNALDTAHALNVPVPLTANVMETMQALKIDDMATNDHSAIVRFYEKLAKVEVRKQ